LDDRFLFWIILLLALNILLLNTLLLSELSPHLHVADAEAELDVAAGVRFVGEWDFLFERSGEAEKSLKWDNSFCD